jgi:NADP-dependent 3-hydroxy acid dehydrogenase YdfG
MVCGWRTQTKARRLLDNKSAVIYGADGTIGGAIARAFARGGARVFLAGCTLARLDTVAAGINVAGGVAENAQVDAPDAKAVDRHAVVQKAGGIDIALKAVGVAHVQGIPFAALSLEDYEYPITVYTRTNFITAQAVARHMAKKNSGVILTLSTPGARLPGPGMLAGAAAGTLLKRLPTLDEVANTAVFLACGCAGAITGTVANLRCVSRRHEAPRLAHFEWPPPPLQGATPAARQSRFRGVPGTGLASPAAGFMRLVPRELADIGGPSALAYRKSAGKRPPSSHENTDQTHHR